MALNCVHLVHFNVFTFSILIFSCLFYPIVGYIVAYAATDAACLLLFLPCLSSLLSGIRGELGIPGPCLLKTNLFTRERRRNMICYISCDTGDTAYAVTLRFVSYTLEKDAERLCLPVRRRHKERHRPTLVRQRAASLDGRCLELRKRALGYVDAMHSSPPVERRGEARRYASRRSSALFSQLLVLFKT